MRLHAFLFSRSCVSLAIRSHSAANFLNSSDRFIERPSDIGLSDIPNFSQSQMCQSQTIQGPRTSFSPSGLNASGLTFSNAEMQHSFAAAHSSSLVIETRLYKVPRPKGGDSNRECIQTIPQHVDSAARPLDLGDRSGGERTNATLHSGYISREAAIVNQPSANPAFEARPLKSASGWYVRVAWPNGKREHVPGFVTKQEAQRWIEDKARVWLSERCSPPETLAPFATAL